MSAFLGCFGAFKESGETPPSKFFSLRTSVALPQGFLHFTFRSLQNRRLFQGKPANGTFEGSLPTSFVAFLFRPRRSTPNFNPRPTLIGSAHGCGTQPRVCRTINSRVWLSKLGQPQNGLARKMETRTRIRLPYFVGFLWTHAHICVFCWSLL